MRIVFHTNSLSPHQLPLARELVQLVGAANYRYVYTQPLTEERKNLGWSKAEIDWAVCEAEDSDNCRAMLEDCEVLISGLRELGLFERRAKKGLKTFYCCERWFKPIEVVSGWSLVVSGRLRLLIPSYRKMVKRFVRLVNETPTMRVLPYGVWAERDFRRMGIAANKMNVIGYCVAPAAPGNKHEAHGANAQKRVLWVGRMIGWKRVDTIIRAARLCPDIDFTLIGRGSIKGYLAKMAEGLDNVTMLDAVPIAEVRNYMRQHDIYVLASNAQEGWGAALNEALEEGMRAVGTYEAGASATILPQSCLFHAGDYKRLADLLKGDLPTVDVGIWSARNQAKRLMDFLSE